MTEKTGSELPGTVGELSTHVRDLVERLTDFADSNDRVVESTNLLAVAVQKDTRNRNLWFRWLGGGLAVVLLIVGIVAVRQNASSDRGQTIKELTTTIADCVNPGGVCYERVQRQKQEDRQRDQLLAVAVATCSANGLRGAPLSSCVRDSMTAADTPNGR